MSGAEIGEVTLDNPAGRLVRFIRRVERSGGRSLAERLADGLGVTLDDKRLLYQRLAEVWGLNYQINEVLDRDDRLSPRYRIVLPAIGAYLTLFDQLPTTGGIPGLVAHPDVGMMATLELLSDDLSKYNSDPHPSVDSLDGLRAELNDLIEYVRSAVAAESLDTSLAGFLLQELHDLEAAIDDYQIAGKGRARYTFARVVGEVSMSNRVGDEGSQPVLRRFVDFLEHYASVFQLGIAAAQLSEAVLLALPPGHR